MSERERRANRLSLVSVHFHISFNGVLVGFRRRRSLLSSLSDCTVAPGTPPVARTFVITSQVSTAPPSWTSNPWKLRNDLY